MQVDESVLKIDARVLKPPTLKYGPNSKQPTIVRDTSLFKMDLFSLDTRLLLATFQWFLEHVNFPQFNDRKLRADILAVKG